MVALRSAGRGGASTGEGAAMVGLPFGHQSTKVLCSLVVRLPPGILLIELLPLPLAPQDVSSQPTAVLCLAVLLTPISFG